MKRILCLCAVLMLPIIGNTTPFKYNNVVELSIGYNSSNYLAINRYPQPQYIIGYQFALNMYGIYMDISFNEEGDYSGNMPLYIIPSYETIDWHIGYSIPVFKWFKIIPLIGQANIYEERYVQLQNNEKYIHKTFYTDLDYGLILQFNIIESLYINIDLQRFRLGINLGISIPL